jgi:hypothetical protein
MAADAPACKFITPPNTLAKVKTGDGKGRIDPRLLARAEAALSKLEEGYPDWAAEEAEGLEQALAAARIDGADRDAQLRRMFRHALDLKGQGGTFGFRLITEIADSLAGFVEPPPALSPRAIEIIQAHIDALHAVIGGGIKGDGGDAGRGIVDGLHLLTA